DDLLQRCLAGEEVRNIEGSRVTRDGTSIDVLLTLSLLRNDKNEPIAIASLAKDITSMREATAEYEGWVRAINRVQAVIEFGLDGTVRHANENFLRIFGYSLEEVVGRHHRMFCDEAYAASPEYAELWQRLTRGEFKAGEFKRLHKDGSLIWLQASYNPIFDKDGDLTKVVKFASDITQEVDARSLAMMEMATPVTRIWDGVLFAPIVGVVDSRRAHDIMNKTLTSIVDQGARVLLLDIGGVGMVDTAVANHLIKIAKAAVLMGCKTIISGISPAIAQTITELGVELGSIRTTSTIEAALREAITKGDATGRPGS
ncbi:MAG: PAS domain S-box protein, partial [Planctomycetota bacterium]